MDLTASKFRTERRFVRYVTPNASPYYSLQNTIFRAGFCYIGKTTSNIERLVKIFKKGYASDKIESVRLELSRNLAADIKTVPEVIFCESGYETSHLKVLSEFLTNHPYYNSVPLVIVQTDPASVAKVDFVRKHKLADDVVDLSQTEDGALQKKVQFLKKTKATAPSHMEPEFNQNSAILRWSPGAIMKRLLDITLSLLALVVLSPILILISLAIYLESGGPIFYTSKRAGRGYKIFDFYKFRTMVVNADQSIRSISHLNQYTSEKEGPIFFKISNDPRITKVGKFLRDTSLDEIPQLFNVLRGDMSLVGNRPLPLYEAASLTTDEYAQRFMAPAGITGLWQIKKRGKSNMSSEERINLDIDYARKNNLVYDLWIMVNTPSALIQKESV